MPTVGFRSAAACARAHSAALFPKNSRRAYGRYVIVRRYTQCRWNITLCNYERYYPRREYFASIRAYVSEILRKTDTEAPSEEMPGPSHFNSIMTFFPLGGIQIESLSDIPEENLGIKSSCNIRIGIARD